MSMNWNWTSQQKRLVLLVAIGLGLLISIGYAFIFQGKQDHIELELVYGESNQDEEWSSDQNESAGVDEVGQVESVEQVEIFIDIKGAVQQPGVYQLFEGDRVIDALAKAGQITEEGSTAHINLAQKVYDGMLIYIPTIGELEEEEHLLVLNVLQESQQAFEQQSSISSSASQKININRAPAEELQKLPGVGASRALAIIEYRTEKGMFQQIEDLMNISGIGPKVFERLKDLVEL